MTLGLGPRGARAEELPPPAPTAPPPAVVAPDTAPPATAPPAAPPEPLPAYSPYLPRGTRFAPGTPAPPTSGAGELIGGGIGFGLGVPVLIGAGFYGRSGCDGQSTCFDRIFVAITVVGAALTVGGVVFLGIGGAKESRYRKWRRAQATQQ